MVDSRRYAPATARNRQPILDVLRQVLPKTGTVLEIASGTGEHATFFAPRLSQLHWLPSEPDQDSRASAAAWVQALPAKNLMDPIALDVSQHPWPVEDEGFALAQPITAIVNINMLHISAWEMCQHLMAGAQRVLPSGGALYLYGPFKQAGQQTAPSNETFDALLRDRNPLWGIRDLEAVSEVAQKHSLALTETIPMPANNFSVVFRRE